LLLAFFPYGTLREGEVKLLTRAKYEFLSDMIPEPKPGGRKREVDMWQVLNAIFYVLVEGVLWRALPGDFLV
jgi:transposase